MSTFRDVVKNEGLVALWSGLTPTLIMAVPSVVFYYTTYDEMKEIMQTSSNPHIQSFAPFISGSLARMVAAALTSPLELMRTMMQHRNHGKNVFSLLRHEFRSRGFLSLWRGLSPSLWRDVPFSGIYWLGYERLSKLAKAHLFQLDPATPAAEVPVSVSFSSAFIAGAVSGSVAAAVTTPMDVVKTRRQVDLYSDGANTLTSKRTFSLLRRIAAEEGVGALFSGVGPRVAKVSPACAIMISTYELGKRFMVVDEQ